MSTFERAIGWIKHGEQGEQVFDDRPFVSYSVVVWKKPTGKVYSVKHANGIEPVYSGTLTLYFKAYNPFGKMAYTSYDTYDSDGASRHCGIISKDEMPPTPTKDSRSFLVYNPGTETSDMIIRIGGSAPNGLTITNETTGDVCRLLSLPAAPDYLEIDSDLGSVKRMPSNPDGFAFEQHDDGYIRLAPCTPYERNVVASYESGSNKIYFPLFSINSKFVRKYLRLNGEWVRIISIQDEHTAIINKAMKTTGIEETLITTMNEITISGSQISLTKLEINYTPLVR